MDVFKENFLFFLEQTALKNFNLQSYSNEKYMETKTEMSQRTHCPKLNAPNVITLLRILLIQFACPLEEFLQRSEKNQVFL